LGFGGGGGQFAFGLRQFARDAIADRFGLGDAGLQRRRLGGDHGALFLDLGKAASHFGEAPRGIARARLPTGHISGLAITRSRATASIWSCAESAAVAF
jgi:hypothetical protein